MTLRVLWSRLRKRNKKDYRQFQFCIVFAMMLVSSYLMMRYSAGEKCHAGGRRYRKNGVFEFGNRSHRLYHVCVVRNQTFPSIQKS